MTRFRQAVGHDQVYWLPLAAAPDVHCQWDCPGSTMWASWATSPWRTRGRRALAASRPSRRAIAPTTSTGATRPRRWARCTASRASSSTPASPGDVTMRVFEGTACGALVLTDAVANGLDELFVPGREIVTYQDDADLLGKIDYYLVERGQARARSPGRAARTLAEHRYTPPRHSSSWPPRSRQVSAAGAHARRASRDERWAARRSVYTHLHMLDALLDGARAAGLPPDPPDLGWRCPA